VNDYASIYLRNQYEVDLTPTQTFIFSLIDLRTHTLFQNSFAIITAHNPQNMILSHRENALRNQLLYSELYKDYKVLKAVGCLEEHCEAGYLVYDIEYKEALRVGLKYKQYAIFYCDTKSLRYVACQSEEVIVLRDLK